MLVRWFPAFLAAGWSTLFIVGGIWTIALGIRRRIWWCKWLLGPFWTLYGIYEGVAFGATLAAG